LIKTGTFILLYTDNVSHEWMIKFIGVRIADLNVKKLISKFLKAGVMDGETIEPTENGTPQGAIISPLLANIYLHYTLDLWFVKAIKPKLRGAATLVRYADDFVGSFLFKEDAEWFYTELQERLVKFGLEIAKNKSKIIEFGRYAGRKRQAKGMGKPETFDFLGFTHYCSQNQWGQYIVKRKTSRKKFKAKVKAFAKWIKQVKDRESIQEIFEKTQAKLRGHYNYYGITYNSRMIAQYHHRVKELLFKWLNRRSQRKSFTWKSFKKYLKENPLPNPKITHRFSNGQLISVR
jgi:RNA-directed DNA polymerase